MSSITISFEPGHLLRTRRTTRFAAGQFVATCRKIAERRILDGAFLAVQKCRDHLFRTPTTTKPTPAINEIVLRIGEIGIVFVSLCES